MGCRETVLVHGGAGSWRKTRARRALPVLERSVITALNALGEGKGSLEAVVRAVEVMEDSGVFNAGRGSVRDAEGRVSMDAGVMDGASGDAGAVAGVTRVANPVRLALEVMRRTSHVLIAGPHADALGVSWGLREWRTRQARKKPEPRLKGRYRARLENTVGDTVGAVAIDSECRPAAAVSTGGLRGKLPGRVGDSPVVGAGFYASPTAAAVATGVGEVIMLSLLSFRVVEGAALPGGVASSARQVVNWVSQVYGENTVGVIAVDTKGLWAMVYNTPHMAWALGVRGERVRVGGLPVS